MPQFCSSGPVQFARWFAWTNWSGGGTGAKQSVGVLNAMWRYWAYWARLSGKDLPLTLFLSKGLGMGSVAAGELGTVFDQACKSQHV